jgi:hypothetical protein
MNTSKEKYQYGVRRIIRLNPGQMKKLSRLLDMEYTPAEIQEETTIDSRIIVRLARERGLPARKTASGHYWIHGLTFATWAAEKAANPRPAAHLEEKDYYCLVCKTVVRIEKMPKREHLPRWDYLMSTCPICSNTVRKYARRETANDKP